MKPVNKKQIQDILVVSMIEKGIELYSNNTLDENNLMEFMNQLNKIRRFMGYDTLKRSEFMCMVNLTDKETET